MWNISNFTIYVYDIVRPKLLFDLSTLTSGDVYRRAIYIKNMLIHTTLPAAAPSERYE